MKADLWVCNSCGAVRLMNQRASVNHPNHPGFSFCRAVVLEEKGDAVVPVHCGGAYELIGKIDVSGAKRAL